LQTKRDRPIVNKLTQEELLAEAAITEEKNKDSLLEWQQKEAERKENAKKKDKQGITGSFVRYHSFMDKCVQEEKPNVQKDNVLTPDQENSDTGVENTINRDAADVEKRLEDDDLMGRNLITFVEAGTTPNRDSNMDIESADKDLDLVDLIDQLAVWREKDPKPNKPILCPITGSIAKYRIPQSCVPYADIEAYKKIKTCEMHQQNWSSLNGLYLGNLPSADGVPNEWY
jgi:vacuolar protein sorting-associated protein 72